MAIWDDLIPEAERAVYAGSGYGRRGQLGNRPVLLIVDVTYGFVGYRGSPESAASFPMSCGEAGWEAVDAMADLLAAARSVEVPVAYTRPASRRTTLDAGRWASKQAHAVPQHVDANRIVAEVEPGPNDVVIDKAKPSAFFATPLVAYLIQLQVDTVVLCGGTTSGCVRASAIDAFSYNFHVAVVEEGCFDRSLVAHKANLFDIQMKYGDVITQREATAYLERVGRRALSAAGGA